MLNISNDREKLSSNIQQMLFKYYPRKKKRKVGRVKSMLYFQLCIYKIAQNVLNKNQQQITSHLQKCQKKIDAVFREFTDKFDTCNYILQFQNQFQQIDRKLQREKFLDFFKTKIAIYKCNLQGPITIDILQSAMKQLRTQISNIPYDTVIENEKNQEMTELLYAIAGIQIKPPKSSPKKIFIYPIYKPQTLDINIKEAKLQFQTKASPMGCLIREQKLNSACFSFNCHFILEYCYQFLEEVVRNYEFNQYLRATLILYGQVIKNGNTFEFALELIKNKWQLNPYKFKLFIFSLKCALGV